MKIIQINCYDFRGWFSLLFLSVTGIGFWLTSSESLPFASMYVLICVLFLLFFGIGSWNIKAHANSLLTSSSFISSACRRRAVCLFVAGQLYYLYVILIVLAKFSSIGFVVFENLRVSIREELIIYLFFPSHFFCLIGACYVLQYEAGSKTHVNSSAPWFTLSIGKLLGLIFIIENLMIGSRSSLLTICWCFYVCMMRGANRRLSIPRVAFYGVVCSYLLGAIAFWRLYSNPQTFNWWVVNGYFSSTDLSDIGFVYPAFVMVGNTLKDMFVRAVVVADAIHIARLDLAYGGVSFFMLYSLLPGVQRDPGLLLNEEIFKTGNETGIPAPLVSQLFWDFGLLGVILGGLIIGWVGSWLIKRAAGPFGGIYTFLLSLYSTQLFLGLYGTFNAGYLVLSFLLGVPISFWLHSGLRLRI